MNKKLPISVVISAYNEEKKIEECLRSVEWADEIIVIDNTSTDKTVLLSKKNGAKVMKRSNNLMLNVNKNFGFTKASNRWILSLDADERVTQELAEEIKTILENDDETKNGFSIPRKNIIFGKWMQHTGWYPDYQMRLFRKGCGKFEERHVHEQMIIQGQTGVLENPMVHMHYETVTQFLNKTFLIYAPNEADELIEKGYTFNYLDAFRFPWNEFLSRYFARQGYKDGLHGLVLSLLMATYHLVVFTMIWEKNKFIEKDKEIISSVEKEMKSNYQALLYWFASERLEKVKNPLVKTYYKIKRKRYS